MASLAKLSLWGIFFWNTPEKCWTVLAFWWSAQFFLLQILGYSGKVVEKKWTRRKAIEKVFLSKQTQKISFPIQQYWVGSVLSSVFLNANIFLKFFISIFLNLQHTQSSTIVKEIFQFCLYAFYVSLTLAFGKLKIK